MSARQSRRRLLLQGLGALASKAAASTLVSSVGCSSQEEALPDGRLRVNLHQLPLNRRVLVGGADRPVEIVRTEQGIRARSLICTHWGCTVQWLEDDGVYRCPCHEARFDHRGRVLAGPPTRPLVELPVLVSGQIVIVGEEPSG